MWATNRVTVTEVLILIASEILNFFQSIETLVSKHPISTNVSSSDKAFPTRKKENSVDKEFSQNEQRNTNPKFHSFIE
jgi:hypothetical protein